MRSEISSFLNLSERLEHRTTDAELGFSKPPTQASRRRYEFNRNETKQRLERIRTEVLKFEFLTRLQEEIPQAEIYLTGGAVRDAIIDKESKDFDFVIGKVEADKLREFLSKYGRVKDVESREFGVFKFYPTQIPEGMKLTEPIEIALPRSEKYRGGGTRRDVKTISDPNLPIEEDLARRDFTVNNIALNLKSGELIDPHDGVGDLEKGILQAVGDPEQRFNFEDPSRILRGLRFACTLGLDIEEKTFQAMQKYSTEIWANLEASRKTTNRLQQIGVNKPTYTTAGYNEIYQQMLAEVETDEGDDKLRVAAETVAKEFLKGFHADPVRMIRLLRDTDALFMMMPELIDTIGIKQPEVHKYDVWGHTLKTLEALPDDASINLQIAALLHDIGKPAVQEIDKEGKIHFYQHKKLSAEMARTICRRLRLSAVEKSGPLYVDRSSVAFLVENHMQLQNFDGMRETIKEKY
ncbi:MAG: CCA tRNA nucleotidyltransferase, partial [Candidatus Cloacimonetes bacterium]|nr:CCA tRNA nucleotidyltransferase [Candidatus Cloacimonadota bacterium]